MAVAKSVIGIPIEQEMLNVVNLKPGQSAPFLYYNVYFIDLQNPIGFEEDIDILLKNTHFICNRLEGGGISANYVRDAQANSRYLVVAINKTASREKRHMGQVGAFVLAIQDKTDPEGIYVEASCNIRSSVSRENPQYLEARARHTAEVALLTNEEVVEEFNRTRPSLSTKILTLEEMLESKSLVKSLATTGPRIVGVNRDSRFVRSLLVKRRLDIDNITEKIVTNMHFRMAQLLKLTLFNYANHHLGIRHAYNSASGVSAAKTHARNGMTLRSANCGQPDQLAEQYSKIPLDDKGQYMERMAKEGKFKRDDTEAYPMKLCNYNFNVLFADLLDHTIGVLIKVEKAGYNTEDILSFNMYV